MVQAAKSLSTEVRKQTCCSAALIELICYVLSVLYVKQNLSLNNFYIPLMNTKLYLLKSIFLIFTHHLLKNHIYKFGPGIHCFLFK